MALDFLKKLTTTVDNVGRRTDEFKKAAAKQNSDISKVVRDISRAFSSQSQQQSSITSSIENLTQTSAATSQKVDQTNVILQESISVQNNMLSQLKNISTTMEKLFEMASINNTNRNSQEQTQAGSSGLLSGLLGAGIGGITGAAIASSASDLLPRLQSSNLLSDLFASENRNTQYDSTQIGFRNTGGEREGGGGGKLTVEDMVKLAKEAGFSDQDAAIMGAIGAAESSGNPSAHNTKGRDNSYGLWQMNLKYGQDEIARRMNSWGVSDPNELFDPRKNAKAAFELWKEQGFNAWSVYKSGDYKQYYGSALNAISSPTSTPVEADSDEKFVSATGNDGGGVLNSIGSVNSAGGLKERKGFIIHHTGGRGDVGGVVNTLNQRGLSVQFVIDREGQIHQLLPSGARGRHIRKGQGVGKGLSNSNTEGVEIIAKDDSDILPVQVEAAKRLVSQLGYSPNQVYGHGEINPHKQRTEGATVISAIRGGSPPIDPSTGESATGSTGLSGEGQQFSDSSGGAQGFAGAGQGMDGLINLMLGQSMGMAGLPFSLLGGMLGGGSPASLITGIMGAAIPSILNSFQSGGSSQNKEDRVSVRFGEGNVEEQYNKVEADSDLLSSAQENSKNAAADFMRNVALDAETAMYNIAAPQQQTRTEASAPPPPQSAGLNNAYGGGYYGATKYEASWAEKLGGKRTFPSLIKGVFV